MTGPSAGALRDRVRFQRRAADANGDRLGAWKDVQTVWAQITYLRGGEGVLQERLAGNQPVVISIRDSSFARDIDNSWRAVGPEGAYDIASNAPSRTRGFRDITAVQAAGQP